MRLVADTCAQQQFYATLEQLQNDVTAKDIQTRMLEEERDREIEEARKLEQQNFRKSKGSRAPSTHSRSGSRRRASSVKPVGRTSANMRDDAVAADATGLNKRSAERTKDAKKAVPNVVPRATGKTKPNTSLIASTTALLSRVQAHMTANSGPFSMLQTIVMLAVIAWMTNNKKMRDRIRKFLILCWIKLARTVGMGMKVTYV